MRADVWVGMREAGVCGTGDLRRSMRCWRIVRVRGGFDRAYKTVDISHFLCWVYAPCSSARTSVERADMCTWWCSILGT
jgi:hypothetical protein